MNTLLKRIFLFIILFTLLSCKGPAGNENSFVSVRTTMGDIKLKLYDATPLHRDNFIKLVKSGFYDGISFHRVIQNFMIQAGDMNTKLNKAGLSDTLDTYTLPAEFRSELFHKRGALAAAREGNDVNPEMRSSGTQFYIVQGTMMTKEQIDQIEQSRNSILLQGYFNTLIKQVADSAAASGKPLNPAEVQELASIRYYNYLSANKAFSIPEEHREIYYSTGGVPRLDAAYTVFGEVVEGMDVVDKIAAVDTDQGDRPVNDVRILKMKIIKK